MQLEALRQQRSAIVREHGDWSAHNIQLEKDVFTFDKADPRFQQYLDGHGQHLRRIMQIVADLVPRPIESLRVLDLGCLEGLYAIEFAQRGAEAVGIEGREANLAKARFAKDALRLDKVRFELDDVRNLTVEKYGKFDVVLCLGLLYHLDTPDVFSFLEQMSSVCESLCIIDTHVATTNSEVRSYKGREYSGSRFREHQPNDSATQKMKSLWASLDNENSFWPTRASLYNAITDSGFTSAYACYSPAVLSQQQDRETIVALKGTPQKLVSTPVQNNADDVRWPKERLFSVHPSAPTRARRLISRVEQKARRLLKRRLP